jgi:hypothetical protein
MMELVITIGILAIAATTALVVLQKRNLSGIVKGIAIISVFVAVGAVAFSLLESDEDIIIRRISTFESAYNRGDLEAMVDCFDPATRTTLKAAISVTDTIIGGLTGYSFNIADMFGLVMGLGPFFDFDTPTISITVESVDINGDKATANVIINAGGSEVHALLHMMKDNMGWYINVLGLFN